MQRRDKLWHIVTLLVKHSASAAQRLAKIENREWLTVVEGLAGITPAHHLIAFSKLACTAGLQPMHLSALQEVTRKTGAQNV